MTGKSCKVTIRGKIARARKSQVMSCNDLKVKIRRNLI